MTNITLCESIRDRMPTVLHGREPWSPTELKHIEECAECRREWSLLANVVSLHQGIVVNTAAITQGLVRRTAALPAEPAVRGFIRPRGQFAGWGLLAAAATVAMVFGLRSERLPLVEPAAPTEVAAVLPELDQLSESELEGVLSTMDTPDDVTTPMRLPRLGDLSETELESLLNEMEG